MTLASYSELQTEALDWMLRSGQSANAPTWIKLAEARLNRELGDVESDNTITGTADSRRIDISALNITDPVALFLAESGLDEVQVQLRKDGTFPYLATAGKPSQAAVDGGNSYIDFDCPLDAAYPFRFRARGKLALSDSVTTNWLLDDHPDVYLAATLMWGAGYNEDWTNGQIWKATLDEGIASVKRLLAKQNKSMLRVDPALRGVGAATYTQLVNGEY